jgi:hypothetical protein
LQVHLASLNGWAVNYLYLQVLRRGGAVAGGLRRVRLINGGNEGKFRIIFGRGLNNMALPGEWAGRQFQGEKPLLF